MPLPQAERGPTHYTNRKDVAKYMPYHEKMRNVCAHAAHIAHIAHIINTAAVANRTAKAVI